MCAEDHKTQNRAETIPQTRRTRTRTCFENGLTGLRQTGSFDFAWK
jgi:hypothetical protein